MFFAAVILVLVTRTNSQTTTESAVTCALIGCKLGYDCIEYPTESRCDPIQKPGECPLTGCPVNPEQSTCTPDSCEVDFDCNGTQKCCKGCNGCGYCFDPPPPPSCKDVKCEPGFFCILRQVICVRLPCPPLPTCVGRAETCSLPADPGPCKALFPSWYYDKKSGQCKQFNYGGCDGNDNRFSTKKECRKACRGIRA